MVARYVQKRLIHEALEASRNTSEFTITKDTIFNLLQSCCRKKDLQTGNHAYSLMVQHSYESIAPLVDPFIRLLATCGSLEDAHKAFSCVRTPSVYTWTALISAHANLGQPHIAIDLHFNMLRDGTRPDRVIFLCVLRSCSSTGSLPHGRLIHHELIEDGMESDISIGNTLVDLYAKCASLDEARVLFHQLSHRNLVSWSALISGFAQYGQNYLAYDFFVHMLDDGFEPPRGMYLCILKVCSSMESIEQGMVIHDQIIRQGLESDLLIGNSLIDVYAKCDYLDAAETIFKMVKNPNLVTWGALINGYAQNGRGHEAFDLFEKMQEKGLKPDKHLITTMFKLCSTMGASKQGELLHEKVSRSGCSLDTAVGNALIDMYCKCGNLNTARKVLNEMNDKDMASWGAMIAGYASHGSYEQVTECLDDMKNQGYKPDTVIFLNVLMACSHAGLVEDSRCHFKSMVKDYNITPDLEHYNCVIDLFSRAGRLNDAADLFHTLSAEPDKIGWRSLLTGCRHFVNSVMADHEGISLRSASL